MAVKASNREGKRAPLSLRTTETLRSALEAAASKSGRSMAQEIETRLERSFQSDSLIEAFLGDGQHTQTMIRVVSTTVNRIEMITGKRWVDDYETLWLCRSAILCALGMVMGEEADTPPPYKPDEWTPEQQKKSEGIARRVARDTMRDFGLLLPGPDAGWFRNIIEKSGTK